MQRNSRLGAFFVFLGAGAIFLFVLSDSTHLPDYRFLFWGIGLIVAGSVMRILHPKSDQPKSTRFRLLRRRDTEEK